MFAFARLPMGKHTILKPLKKRCHFEFKLAALHLITAVMIRSHGSDIQILEKNLTGRLPIIDAVQAYTQEPTGPRALAALSVDTVAWFQCLSCDVHQAQAP
ncbi:hypothetical protein [Fulvimarina sp. MAC3]|uniref:hypothetical protein n=1 Tax=Fulvimarina sp. MAC3 TaxID=3148887 RepID=UPI0031FDB478